MAQTVFFTYPLDQPIKLRDGVVHREADFHGSAHWLYVKPEHPVRAAKGDLGLEYIKDMEPRYSFEHPTQAAPYKLFAKGK